MKQLLLATVFLFLSFGLLHATTTISADNDLIEYTGRIDFSNPLAPQFSYSGVSIRANFSGTSISAILEDERGENYYNVILDGQVIDVLLLSKGKKTYVLAESLTDANHEIELFRRTELSFGKTTFHGFSLDDGKSLSPITNKRELFIEYIGNSITCGYGNEGENGGNFEAKTENHFMTYAAITSRGFNARHMAVSRSGIGVYRNYDGPKTGNEDNMTNLYTHIFMYDAEPIYDFATQPDLVCINLGTNDFSTSGADSALYVSNYFRLIDTIQTKYTNPHIVCLVGSMMGGNALKTVKTYLEFIADSATRKGMGTVNFFEMSEQSGDLGIGVHYHPTVAQHAFNATELTEYLRNLKQWKVTPLLLSAETITAKQLQLTFNTELMSSEAIGAGFSIAQGEIKFTIDSAKQSTEDAKVLQVYFNEVLEIEKSIVLDYASGNVQSLDTVAMAPISHRSVENSLVESFIKTGAVNKDGESIKLTFNKKLNVNSTIDGLRVYSLDGDLSIASFDISTKYLNLVVDGEMSASDSVFIDYDGTGIVGEDEVLVSPILRLALSNKSEITSVKETLTQKAFAIWPNPNSERVFYYTSNESATGNYEVVNQSGQIIASGGIHSAEGKLSLGDVNEGVYFIRINTLNKVEVHELLIVN